MRNRKVNIFNFGNNFLIYIGIFSQYSLDFFNFKHLGQVRSALKLIESETCIRFDEIDYGPPSLDHLKFTDMGGCWSYVGKTGGRQEKRSKC